MWNKNDTIKPVEIGKKFFELSSESKIDEVKIENLINLIGFAKYLFEIINNEYDKEPFKLDSSIGNYFLRGKILSLSDDCWDFNLENLGKYSFFHRECLNKCRYCK